MDSPLLAGLLVFAAIFGIGALVENWSWSKPLAVIGAIGLVIESVALFLR